VAESLHIGQRNQLPGRIPRIDTVAGDEYAALRNTLSKAKGKRHGRADSRSALPGTTREVAIGDAAIGNPGGQPPVLNPLLAMAEGAGAAEMAKFLAHGAGCRHGEPGDDPRFGALTLREED